MIRTERMTEAGFKTIKEAKRNGKWNNASSFEMASTLPKAPEKALKENDLAWKNFKKLSNSRKFRYIYWVNSANKDETLQKRIFKIVKKVSQKQNFHNI